MEAKQSNWLDEQEMLFAQEEIKVDSSLDTSEDTTDESEQSEDDQQNEGEREADENQIDRLEISV